MWRVSIFTVVGVSVTPVIWKGAEPISTEAVPDFVASSVLLARTVTVFGFGGLAEAV